jgi:ABC-type multidrug transport system permease subunit
MSWGEDIDWGLVGEAMRRDRLMDERKRRRARIALALTFLIGAMGVSVSYVLGSIALALVLMVIWFAGFAIVYRRVMPYSRLWHARTWAPVVAVLSTLRRSRPAD